MINIASIARRRPGLAVALSGLATSAFIAFSPVRITSDAAETAEHGGIYWQQATDRDHPTISFNETWVTLCMALSAVAMGTAPGKENARRPQHIAATSRLPRVSDKRSKNWTSRLQIMDLQGNYAARAIADSIWQQHCTAAEQTKHAQHMGLKVTAAPVDTIVLQRHDGKKGLIVLHSTPLRLDNDHTTTKMWTMNFVSQRDYEQARREKNHIPLAAGMPLSFTPRGRLKPKSTKAARVLNDAQGLLRDIAAIAKDPRIAKGWEEHAIAPLLQSVVEQASLPLETRLKMPSTTDLLALNAEVPHDVSIRHLPRDMQERTIRLRGTDIQSKLPLPVYTAAQTTVEQIDPTYVARRTALNSNAATVAPHTAPMAA